MIHAVSLPAFLAPKIVLAGLIDAGFAMAEEGCGRIIAAAEAGQHVKDGLDFEARSFRALAAKCRFWLREVIEPAGQTPAALASLREPIADIEAGTQWDPPGATLVVLATKILHPATYAFLDEAKPEAQETAWAFVVRAT